MVWLGTVITLGAIGLAIVVGGAAAGPIQKMIDAEQPADRPDQAERDRPAGRGSAMRGKGINYDTGFYPGGVSSREHFDAGIVRREMQVIAGSCTARPCGSPAAIPARLSVAGELAAAEGLEVWFAPFPCELTTDAAGPAARGLRGPRRAPAPGRCDVVLVTRLRADAVRAPGFLPGGTVYERIAGPAGRRPAAVRAFAALPGKLNGFLAATAEAARGRFGGPLTYASGMWEPVDWSPFDIAATDAYRDAGNAGHFRSGAAQAAPARQAARGHRVRLLRLRGRGDRGGMGWAIIDASADPPRPGRRLRARRSASRSGTWRS